MRCFVGFSYIHSNIASTINTSFLNETIQSTVQKALPYFLLSALSSASLIPSLLQKHFLIQGLTREGSKVVKKLFQQAVVDRPCGECLVNMQYCYSVTLQIGICVKVFLSDSRTSWSKWRLSWAVMATNMTTAMESGSTFHPKLSIQKNTIF